MRAAHGLGRGAAAALAAFATLVAAIEASAAVRLCGPLVSSGIVAGASQRAARKAALDAWKAKALEQGESYGAWRIAADKFLKCLRRKDRRGFECIASARPCMIEQAPERRKLREKRMGI